MATIDDAFAQFTRDAEDAMHEELAKGAAEQVRAAGLVSADQVEFDVETDTDDPPFRIDVERVRRRANEFLAE